MANQIEEILAGSLNEFRAQKNVVMNIVDANGQRPHGKGDVIAPQVYARRVGRAGRQKFVGHTFGQGAFSG